ncbi:hypothetical protein [Borrelia sp. RT1S]|uniref:hypothetical protein n=1 Tax=Borrelia sp. RT1S TaxID=2898580 RepID=UPI001E562F80|nr:hypothetical protein [Borrelia sp. RT1S]UGQ17892.1 hypothetical protein LSO05_05525 [Borrelia sp. RT1S]
MRFRPKHVATKAWIRRDKFWKIDMGRDIQEKSQDASITNFPVLTAQDMNWDYIYAYVLEWIEKKCKNRQNIVVKKQDNEYLCEAKSCFRFNTILEALYKDFKEIFIRVDVVQEPVPQQHERGAVQPAAVAQEQQAAVVQEDQQARQPEAVVQEDQQARQPAKGRGKQAPDLQAKAAVNPEETMQPKPPLKKPKKEKDS